MVVQDDDVHAALRERSNGGGGGGTAIHGQEQGGRRARQAMVHGLGAQAVAFVHAVGEVGADVPAKGAEDLQQQRGGGNTVHVVVPEDDDGLVAAAGQEKALDGSGHVGQQERVGQVLEPGLEEGCGGGGVSQATVQEALGEERRDFEGVGQLAGEAGLRGSEGPAALHGLTPMAGERACYRGARRRLIGQWKGGGCPPPRPVRRRWECPPGTRAAAAVVRVEEHFDAHEYQDDGQAVFEVAEIAEGAGQQEIERAQAQDGEHVGGEDDEGFAGDSEDRGDGVHGEKQVGGFDHHQDQGQGGESLATVPAGGELLAVKGGCDGIELAHPLDDAVLLGVDLGLHEEHPQPAVEEEGAEDVEHPVHHVDERNADADHQAAHEQRPQDAPEEDAVLELLGNAEIGEDEGDDEDVVHREGQLDGVASDELEGLLVSAQRLEAQGKEHRQAEPDERAQERLPELDDVGAAMEDAQVQSQKHQHARDESDPVPPGDFNHGEHGVSSPAAQGAGEGARR